MPRVRNGTKTTRKHGRVPVSLFSCTRYQISKINLILLGGHELKPCSNYSGLPFCAAVISIPTQWVWGPLTDMKFLKDEKTRFFECVSSVRISCLIYLSRPYWQNIWRYIQKIKKIFIKRCCSVYASSESWPNSPGSVNSSRIASFLALNHMLP